MVTITPNRRRHACAQASATALALAAGLFGATTALAQDAYQIEEVVVTAQRVESRLQQTPIAVTAITAQQIEAQSAATIGDIVETVPNLSRTSGPTGGNDAFFFIRGIGQVDSNPAGDPGVGVYVDEVYLGRVQGGALDTLDIAQIEVLRGPQGTLFGRNTIGGAISVVTADPADTFGGKARVLFGSRDRLEALVSVDAPLSDAFGLKISGFSRSQRGWGENVRNGTTYGDVDNYGGRVKAVFRPTDALTIKFAADIMRGEGSPAQTVLLGVNPLAGQIPGTTPLGVPFPRDLLVDTSTDLFKSFASIPPINDLKSDGQSLLVSYDLGEVTLKSITSRRAVSQFVHNDFDATGYTLYDNFFDTDQEQFSQELQLSGAHFDGRFNWLAGAYYYNEEVRHNNAICMGTNNGVPPGFTAQRFATGCLRNNQAFDLNIDSWALFGNARVGLTDQLTLTLGARYTHEEKKQDYRFFIDNRAGVFSFFGFPPIVIPTIVAEVEDSWNKLTPKVGVDYRVNERVFLYASYGKGFKSGGFDGRPIPGSPIRSYDPETIDTFEAGAKMDLFDRRLRMNLAAFYSEYKDIQLLVVDPMSGFFVLTNAGDSEISGLEAEVVALPTPNLRLQAGIGWTDDKYSSLAPGAAYAGIDKNDSLPLTPDWTVNLSAQYTIPLSVGELMLRADYNYRSEVAYGAPNAPLELEGGLGLLDLRASLNINDRVTLSVFSTNVTDETYISNAQDVRGALGVAFGQVGAPREWGAELSAKF